MKTRNNPGTLGESMLQKAFRRSTPLVQSQGFENMTRESAGRPFSWQQGATKTTQGGLDPQQYVADLTWLNTIEVSQRQDSWST